MNNELARASTRPPLAFGASPQENMDIYAIPPTKDHGPLNAVLGPLTTYDETQKNKVSGKLT